MLRRRATELKEHTKKHTLDPSPQPCPPSRNLKLIAIKLRSSTMFLKKESHSVITCTLWRGNDDDGKTSGIISMQESRPQEKKVVT